MEASAPGVRGHGFFLIRCDIKLDIASVYRLIVIYNNKW
jgi:hypothetical protein